MTLAGTPADETDELVESYRCPAEIASVARGMLEACPATDPRGFSLIAIEVADGLPFERTQIDPNE